MKIIKKFIIIFISITISIILFKCYKTDKLMPKIFKYGILLVNSGSMQNELQIGDIIIIKESEKYEVNDIITYSVNNQYLVTHRIIRVLDNGKFVTQGDNNNTADSNCVSTQEIEGKLIYNSKLLKWLYNNWILATLVIFLIVILL